MQLTHINKAERTHNGFETGDVKHDDIREYHAVYRDGIHVNFTAKMRQYYVSYIFGKLSKIYIKLYFRLSPYQNKWIYSSVLMSYLSESYLIYIFFFYNYLKLSTYHRKFHFFIFLI